ncbi:MAG TPA: tripartite tricarboxylate transporter substrate binding protein [Xanthobacteraceae bacterium]|nr:tripartite tricarboxylate transporter substrate binding protein [Xanthobacteraceae bacterium]
MELPRRQFLRFAAAAVVPMIPATLWAEPFPARPITIVVPIAAGGAVDTAARIIAEKLQEKLRQSVVVENRPGAGSLIGTNFVAKAAPDGYTLLLMEPGAVLAKWLNKAVPFDVTRDFSPIAMVATSPLVLFAHPSVGFNDVKELIAYGKANPGMLSVGTPGIGTPHHLAAAWLNTAAKIQITHVPYRGAGPALNDLLGGQIPLVWASPVAVLPFFEQGKVKALAVSTRRRDRMLPNVPTMAESGVPEFDTANWFGIAAPAKVRPEIIARVGQAAHEVTEIRDVQMRMSTLGLSIDFRDSDQFRELIINDHQKYETIVREAGIHPG